MAERASYSRAVPFDGAAFGRRIAAAREWLGLEPKQLAQPLGVSPETINRWERGGLENPPVKGQVRLLAEVLHQTEEWLLTGEQPPWSAAIGTSESPSATPGLDRLERRLGSLEAEVAEAVTLAREALELLREAQSRVDEAEQSPTAREHGR